LLEELSPLNPPPKEHWLVALKGYFDGGNQVDSTQYDRITLAVACGTGEQWTPCESAWNTVREEHKAPPLHTTDAIGLNKEFSRKKGWDHDKVDLFIDDCVNVIEKHIVVPGVFVPEVSGRLIPSIARDGLNIFTFTIPLEDYKRAREIVTLLPESCAEICVSECLGIVARWGTRIGAEAYELYFDRNEPFFGHAYDRWVNKKSKRQINFMEKVVHCGPTNASVSAALQIADLFAWTSNHINDVRRSWHRRLNALSWDSLILDYNLLLNPTRGALQRTAEWNLPPRKMDR
jgi:hypothetical protein